MALNAEEDVLKRLAGIKDARGPVGEMARGKNMYPGGNAARSGGGPDIGRPVEKPNPTAVGPQALAAVLAKTGQTPANTAPPPGAMQGAPALVSPGSIMAANPNAERMQAAAVRRMKKGQ